MTDDFVSIIRNAIPGWQRGNKKQGRSTVQNAVETALMKAGYFVDKEDGGCFLRAGMPIWQRYTRCGFEVEWTKRRRRIDLVVYDPSNRAPLALVEIESDLAHMGAKSNRFSRNGYAVASIASGANGQPFDSYNSVERMAAAAQYWAMKQANSGRYPEPAEGVEHLKSIYSDSSSEHNPAGIGLFLVSHFAKPEHVQLLQRRLDSLRMQVIVGTSGS